MTDPLEDILKQIEKHTPMDHKYAHKEEFKKHSKMELMSDTQQENLTINPRENICQINRKMNSRQKDSVNSVPLYINIEGSIRKVTFTPEPDMEE